MRRPISERFRRHHRLNIVSDASPIPPTASSAIATTSSFHPAHMILFRFAGLYHMDRNVPVGEHLSIKLFSVRKAHW